MNTRPALSSKRNTLIQNQTPAEQVLWEHLKSKQLGATFTRQQQIDNYIVDFCCPSHRLIIELDGYQHRFGIDEPLYHNYAYYQKRRHDLRKKGYIYLQFWNYEVIHSTEKVVGKINKMLSLQ